MLVKSTILSSPFPLLDDELNGVGVDDELNGVGVVVENTCRMEVGSVCVKPSLELCRTVCVRVALEV